MAFKVFEKGSAPVSTVPSVTIQKRGLFSLNHAAARMLRDPEAVQFLWDAEEKLIGLRAVALTDPNAYPVRLLNPAKSRAEGNTGPLLVAGTLFTRHIGLDTSEAHRWVPRLMDDLLIIDLKEPGQLVIANRNRGKGARSQSEDRVDQRT